MSDDALLPPTFVERLSRLSQPFVWGRRTLHMALVDELAGAEERYGLLARQYRQAQDQLSELTSHGQALQTQLVETQAALAAGERCNVVLTQDLAQLREEQISLNADYVSLQQQHGDTWTRFALVSRLLAASPDKIDGLLRFRNLLQADYMSFAEAESSLAAEAKAFLMLQSIERELVLLVGFPDMYQRSIVGIVGGFSAGKSEFINSFIQDPEIRLAVGIQPVTAIPSYVMASTQQVIRGYSINGGHISLDASFYKKISHAFINSFSFDLKSLMPFVCVGASMDPAYFANICFIDTPGYNPPTTAAEHSSSDKRTAVQFAQQADAIIWLIGLDVNGTVPESDLAFIHEIGGDERPIYVVLNKADLRAEDQIEEVMDVVLECLDFEGIDICGISAYSATRRRVLSSRGSDLMAYFSTLNRPRDIMHHLFRRLDDVFDMYDQAIETDKQRVLHSESIMKTLELDALEAGVETVYENIVSVREQQGNEQNIALYQKWLEQSQGLRAMFREAIQLAVETI